LERDKILRVYTRLKSLRNNLPQRYNIHEKYVQEYHEIVNLLSEETGSSLKEFKVPDEELERKVTSAWPSIPYLKQKAGRRYSEERRCERNMLVSKLDALLSYFEFKYLSEKRTDIGFKPPKKKAEQ
jgi:hypothetical protein